MLGNNLKWCREELEMTQKELGYVFGVHESTVSGWETGKDIIPLKKLIKFCNLYNYSLDFVVGLSRQNDKHINIDKVDKKVIGNNLKKLRAKLNLTQQKIANECMISQTTYSNYELGLYLINTLSLYTICKRHKLSMYEIIK
ncbi:MAG: helix-turn-helix transcriptional regulator [Bacilli bacterium]|nr:helix-turn-helix transcriptional regulator [Bacilli bacterium]MDY5058863.1 helix-turn-helix transcriptional regulator [Bacilli bacterium]